MPYCHKCGKSNCEDDSFCEHCGASIKEFLKETEKEAEKIVKKTSTGKFVVFIIILICLGYLILDIWAVSQLTPVISLDSALASISNFNGQIGLSQTSASTTLRIENPTFVPILFTRITYDANYGDTKIAEGKTGFFAIGANSQQDVPVDLTIYNKEAISSVLNGVWNALTGKTERAYVNIYADIGIIKLKIKTLE